MNTSPKSSRTPPIRASSTRVKEKLYGSHAAVVFQVAYAFILLLCIYLFLFIRSLSSGGYKTYFLDIAIGLPL
jgi:hypothetical protein